ncbi:MAG: Lar family restriction alleviation protein [Clostridia bacterium]|nr:Lar family restriction alleviation protein [Clostridia bacterium]
MNEQYDKTLKPCPFCGGKANKKIAPMFGTVMFVCEKCGADVCFYGAEHGEKAVEAWNRRVENEH